MEYPVGLNMKIMSKNKSLNTYVFICLALFGGSSWASDGGWTSPFLTEVSNTYNVEEKDYSISVSYSCEYKVNGYIQSLTIFITEGFLDGYTFDLDSELDIELIRDNNRLLFHRLTEEELLNILAERKSRIKLKSSLPRGPIPISQFRQAMLDDKKINGVPISELVETGKKFSLRVLLDGIEIKQITVDLAFVVENKFKGIARSCESDEQLEARMEESNRQVVKEAKRKNMIGLIKLILFLAFLGIIPLGLNLFLKKRSVKNSK